MPLFSFIPNSKSRGIVSRLGGEVIRCCTYWRTGATARTLEDVEENHGKTIVDAEHWHTTGIVINMSDELSKIVGNIQARAKGARICLPGKHGITCTINMLPPGAAHARGIERGGSGYKRDGWGMYRGY